MTPKSQTFCIYCQVEYHTEKLLKEHLRRSHKGTYAQHNLAPMKTRQRKKA